MWLTRSGASACTPEAYAPANPSAGESRTGEVARGTEKACRVPPVRFSEEAEPGSPRPQRRADQVAKSASAVIEARAERLAIMDAPQGMNV